MKMCYVFQRQPNRIYYTKMLNQNESIEFALTQKNVLSYQFKLLERKMKCVRLMSN